MFSEHLEIIEPMASTESFLSSYPYFDNLEQIQIHLITYAYIYQNACTQTCLHCSFYLLAWLLANVNILRLFPMLESRFMSFCIV